jgi:hypothetical protein
MGILERVICANHITFDTLIVDVASLRLWRESFEVNDHGIMTMITKAHSHEDDPCRQV